MIQDVRPGYGEHGQSQTDVSPMTAREIEASIFVRLDDDRLVQHAWSSIRTGCRSIARQFAAIIG